MILTQDSRPLPSVSKAYYYLIIRYPVFETIRITVMLCGSNCVACSVRMFTDGLLIYSDLAALGTSRRIRDNSHTIYHRDGIGCSKLSIYGQDRIENPSASPTSLTNTHINNTCAHTTKQHSGRINTRNIVVDIKSHRCSRYLNNIACLSWKGPNCNNLGSMHRIVAAK
jgi:hypothetical protein